MMLKLILNIGCKEWLCAWHTYLGSTRETRPNPFGQSQGSTGRTVEAKKNQEQYVLAMKTQHGSPQPPNLLDGTTQSGSTKALLFELSIL
jgi:hypothetical protein